LETTTRRVIEVEALLARVLACAPARRARLLEQACGGDAAFRERIERLVRLAESDGGFLERPPLRAEADAALPARFAGGLRVGAYRLVRRIGRGGSSEVWLAEREGGGYAQRAAIKLLRDADSATRERFATECAILASLEHPGIARLYEADVDTNGDAHLVIEYVEGVCLTEHARALPLRERLELFLQVCDAVAYAHTRLVVHRDIKPANILVTREGRAKLLDFGIARLLDPARAREATQTVLLSPAYAAPEQLTGGLIGTPADVYALGVTLFELLTGRLPWTSEGAPMSAALRRLADKPAPAPSRHAGDGGVAAAELRGDIDAIVRRALRADPDERYPDARALADDIRRHLAHEPVAARAGATGYHLRRFARRHWIGLASATAVFAAMAFALAGIAWQARKARDEARSAAAVQAFLVQLFRHASMRQPDPAKARATTARELLDIGAKRIVGELDDAPLQKLKLLHLFTDLYGEFALAADSVPLLRSAIQADREAHGPDSLELATDLLALARLTDDAQTDAALEEARAILDRRGEHDSILRGQLLAAMAGRHHRSDMPRAASEIDAAIAIFDAQPPSVELADALYLKGLVAFYRARHAESIDALQRAVAVGRLPAIEPRAMLSTYYRQLGEAQSYAMRHDEARESLQHAIDEARASGGEHDYDLVRAQTTMAVALGNADRLDEALAHASQAKAAAPTGDDGVEANHLRTYALNVASRAALRAGDPEAALADAKAAVALARGFDRGGAFVAGTLQRLAAALLEQGRDGEAEHAIVEASDILARIGRPPDEMMAMLRVRAALDANRAAVAREQLGSLPAPADDAAIAFVSGLHRGVAEAEIDLLDGAAERASRRAARLAAAARAHALAPSLGSLVADADLVDGRARLATGDAAGAVAPLEAALAARRRLQLPRSPRIAEAALALAEAEFALGRADAARAHLGEAQAILAHHPRLAARYTAPLQRRSATRPAPSPLRRADAGP